MIMTYEQPAVDASDMYWEIYDDQQTEDFDYIGIAGGDIQPLTDIEVQVAELYRLYGRRVEIRVYRERR